LIAYNLRSDKLTDISYALSFLSLNGLALAYAHRVSAYSLVLFLLVAVWSVRIGGFLLIRVLKVGKDQRFDDMRGSLVRFGKFWLGQAITAWVLTLPLTIAQYRGDRVNYLSLAGVLVYATGLVIETIADYQKFVFKQDPKNKNHWIDSGLWKYSRHPNYLGEIMVWIGVYMYCVSALTVFERIVGLASPALIMALLLFVSGIPILEKSADQRWGKLPAYQAYKAKTGLLLPLRTIKN